MDVALVQHVFPDDRNEALQQGRRAVEDASRAGADLVVFPELSFSPFYPRIPIEERSESPFDLAEPIPGPTTETIAEVAEAYGVVVVVNLLERDGDCTYDTAPVIDADGTLLGATRMMHITAYESFHEKGYYAPGDTGAPVYDTAVGQLGVAICYDRHFPEYLRALVLQDAEIVAIPQAGVDGEWPTGMYEAEIQVGSMQHGFFAALANRVGRDGHMEFSGGSLVTDPFGRIVAQAPTNEPAVLHAPVDLEQCTEGPARSLFCRHRRPDQYEGGSVALEKCVPAHAEPKSKGGP